MFRLSNLLLLIQPRSLLMKWLSVSTKRAFHSPLKIPHVKEDRNVAKNNKVLEL
jgi:hypothetical protein